MKTLTINLLTVLFQICPLFKGEKFAELWMNPNPAASPNNWDLFYSGTREECEAIIRRSVAAAIEADKPTPPEPPEYMVGSIKLMFLGHGIADCFIEELEEINTLAKGSVEYDLIRDMWEDLLDSHIQCRHRDCGLCNGVACEESVQVAIPKALLNATQAQREKAPTERGVSKTQAYQWDYDDKGKCHW